MPPLNPNGLTAEALRVRLASRKRSLVVASSTREVLMQKLGTFLTTLALTLSPLAACSSAKSTTDATSPAVVHRSGPVEVRARPGAGASAKPGNLTIQIEGCSCGDPDWCNYGYPHDDTTRGFDCSENGYTYMCLCDCGWNCVPVD